MNRAPGRASRKPRRSLHDIADELGYTVGQFSLERMAETAEVVAAKLQELKDGTLSLKERDLLYKEAADLMRTEREWADFFSPKLKATELSGPDGSDLFASLTDTERAARVAAIFDAARARRDAGAVDGGEAVDAGSGSTDDSSTD